MGMSVSYDCHLRVEMLRVLSLDSATCQSACSRLTILIIPLQYGLSTGYVLPLRTLYLFYLYFMPFS